MSDAEIEALTAERDALREALRPFGEAYRLGYTLCKSQTLGDWEALAKQHTKLGAYRSAYIALKGQTDE